MTTATPPRPSASPQPSRRPGGPPPAARAQAATVDPVKLLKKHKVTLIIATCVGVGIGIAGHFALLIFWPFWTASAVYQCFPPQEELGQKTGQVSGSEEELERFMATQAALLTSDRVLSSAAEDPRLQTEAPKWSKQFMKRGNFDAAKAAIVLKDTVRARVVTNTQFIEVSLTWRDKVDVAGVVSVVNDAYWRDLNYQTRQSVGDEKDAAAKAVQQVEAQIKRLGDERETLLREAGIDSLDERVGMIAQSISLATAQRSEILMAAEGMRDELLALERELRGVTGTPTFPDTMRQEVEFHSLVLNAKAQIQQLESQLSALQQRGIAPGHRSYEQLQATIDGYNQELENLRNTLLMETFTGRIDGLRQVLRQMGAQVADIDKRILEDKVKRNDLLRLEQKIFDIQSEIDLLQISKSEYQQVLTTLENLEDLDTSKRVIIAEAPRVPTRITFPKIYIMVPLGVMVTLGLVVGVIFIAETLDQRVKGPADIAMISRTRVLGIIPHASEDPTNPKRLETVFTDHERGVIAESYRQLRASILKSMRRGDYRTLLVVSGMPGSGATSVVSNLALACAAADQKVLVVDANFRRPRQHVVAGTAEAPGLADVLAGTHTLDNAVQRSADGRFDVLSAGSADQRMFEHLATQRMHSTLADAARDYDLVLIDVAPAVVAGDASELANRVDATCLITRAYAEKRGMIARLRNDLDESRGEFLGVVVNGVRSSAGGYFKRNIKATHQYQNSD